MFWSQENVDAVRLLLQARANCQPVDDGGCTPLVIACESGNLEACLTYIRPDQKYRYCNVAKVGGCSMTGMILKPLQNDTVHPN